MRFAYLPPAARMLSRRVKIAFKGVRRYEGDARQICRQIIDDCYQGGFFRVSNGHFREFYARDFGWTVESLICLGYRKQVDSTLVHVLDAYQRHGKVEQCVTASGRCFTFPMAVSVDALAFLVHAMRISGNKQLTRRFGGFIEHEAQRLLDEAVDKSTGLVRRDLHTSTMKDYAIRKSSCYDNCMLGMLSDDLERLDLSNPFKVYDYHMLILKHFWNGRFFYEDLSGSRTVCGDANVLPFWTGLVKDKAKLHSALHEIRKVGLDRPFPLKYTSTAKRKQKMIGLELLAGDYERDAVWMHLGLMYLRIVDDKRLASRYAVLYKELIETHKNFLEVYTRDGKPFKTPIYYTDEGMIWCANWLAH